MGSSQWCTLQRLLLLHLPIDNAATPELLHYHPPLPPSAASYSTAALSPSTTALPSSAFSPQLVYLQVLQSVGNSCMLVNIGSGVSNQAAHTTAEHTSPHHTITITTHHSPHHHSAHHHSAHHHSAHHHSAHYHSPLTIRLCIR